MLLANRTALIYGASGAVSEAVARAFSREGATVLLAGRRRAPLEALAADLSSQGVREAWQLYGDQKGLTFDQVHREFAKDTPLRRITPLAQVANAAVLLASDLAAGMTATMANATGGVSP